MSQSWQKRGGLNGNECQPPEEMWGIQRKEITRQVCPHVSLRKTKTPKFEDNSFEVRYSQRGSVANFARPPSRSLGGVTSTSSAFLFPLLPEVFDRLS